MDFPYFAYSIILPTAYASTTWSLYRTTPKVASKKLKIPDSAIECVQIMFGSFHILNIQKSQPPVNASTTWYQNSTTPNYGAHARRAHT